jgi:hypothetical protein
LVTLAERVDRAVGQAWIDHITALEPDAPVITAIARRWIMFADPATQVKRNEVERALEAAQKRVRKLEEDFYVYGKMDEGRFEELSEGQRAVIESASSTLEAVGAESGLSYVPQPDALKEAWGQADMVDKRMC